MMVSQFSRLRGFIIKTYDCQKLSLDLSRMNQNALDIVMPQQQYTLPPHEASILELLDLIRGSICHLLKRVKNLILRSVTWKNNFPLCRREDGEDHVGNISRHGKRNRRIKTLNRFDERRSQLRRLG